MKYLEVRDRATFIPVVAFCSYEVVFAADSQYALSEPQRSRIVGYGIARNGFRVARGEHPGDDQVIVVRLDNVAATADPYDWTNGARTIREAHNYITANYQELRDGDVIDVEYILQETASKKRSEALDDSPVGKAPKTYRYAPQYRPPGYATVPDGWRTVERGTGGHFPRRTDLPEGKTVFGIIEYDRQLTQKEIDDYELTEVI
jgi:hypothetical protein